MHTPPNGWLGAEAYQNACIDFSCQPIGMQYSHLSNSMPAILEISYP